MAAIRTEPPPGWTVQQTVGGNWETQEGGGHRGISIMRSDAVALAWSMYEESPKRTELQYNLQKARALATELRCLLENELPEDAPEGFFEASWEWLVNEAMSDVGEIEGFLDNLTKHEPQLIGEGHVKLEIEPHVQ